MKSQYDDLCTEVREQAAAAVAIVIVLGGRHGGGFSVQVARHARAAEFVARLPGILEALADQIRRDTVQCNEP